MINLRKKIWKSVTILLSILVLIVLTGAGLLYFQAQSYLNKNLSEFVEKKSKGKYQLTFENLEINFVHLGFEINQVSFHPTDSIIKTLEHKDISKRFYSFSSPNIRFGGIQLFRLIFSKNLEIDEILISQPELNIHGKQAEQSDQKDNINTLMLELKPLVTKSFNSIKIGKIELANASFDFYNLLGDTKKLSNAEHVTIGVLKFYTDSLLLPDPTRLFDAEDIYLRMQKYQSKLADSIHTLSAESVTYSLKRSQIDAQNIELKPNNNNISAKAKYHITVGKSKISSSQISGFYQSKAVPIDSLILSGVKIKYWPGQKRVKTHLETIDEFDLYDIIKDEFFSISIQHFKLENAQLELFKTQSAAESHQELKNITINLDDFLLDSLAIQDTSRIFYSRNIRFSASEYELTLGDNIHRIRAGFLDLSTQNRSVLVKNIQLYPLRSGQAINLNLKNTIDASCDSIRLDLFNFKKAYHQKRFVFQRINIFNPEVKLIQNEVAEEKATPEDPSFIYKLISGYVKGIYSSQVSVQKGKMQLINKTGVHQTGNIESSVKLNLSGFALDEVSAQRTDRLFFANQIELNFNNYQMQLVDQLHKLTIENLSISSRKKLASLQNLHLYPVSAVNMEELLKKYNRSELYEFTIPELSLTNVDFHEAFYNKKLAVDTLSIKTPQIYFENFAQLKQLKPKVEFEDFFQLLSNYLENIQLNKVDIPDGTIRLINHSRKGKTISLDNRFSLGMENTLVNKDQFGKKRLFFSEYVDFSVRDHLIRLSDNVHVLKAVEVGFSTKKKEVFAINARLYPEADSKAYSAVNWNIQIAVPEIRIKGIDIEKLYFDRKINADNLLINSPEIKLYQKHKKVVSTELKDISIPLPKEIESIEIRQFRLNGGSLKVFSETGIQPVLLVQSDLKMSAQNITVQNNQATQKPEFISGSYTAEMLQFKFTPKDKNQQFSIDELTFSTSDKRISARQLLVKPKTKNTKQNQFELRIPTLVMEGFNIDKAYQNDQFFFESIVLDAPTIQLYNNAKDSLKINPFKVNLYPHFESFADIFASKSVRVKNADISVLKNGKKTGQEKITFGLSNVQIENKPPTGFMHATDFSFSIPNLRRQEKFYLFTAGEATYSSKNNRFSIRDIQIIPSLSKERYQQKIGFQSDYFSGKIDSVFVVQPNIRQWFNKEELIGKYLSVNGLNIDIYRDKRMPFDETRRPDMLQDLIKSLKLPFQLDSFKLVNSAISYSEQVASANDIGQIRFSSIQASLKPFTNMENPGGKIPDLNLVGMANIMDSAIVKVRMNYQMNHPDNLFNVSGSVSPFNMRILNPVLEPLASVSLRSGKVEHFQFTFSADNEKADGFLLFGYDDLKIAILEKKNGNVKEAKFTSFLANSLMLKSKNPRGGELLPDEISFQRDQKRSVLNYWWKSVFSGVRNTLGIKDNKQEQQKE
jgi:hypothetical protein